MSRPLFGILPDEIETKLLDGTERIDQSSPGAEVGRVGPDTLELRADGWHLVLQTDARGKLSREAHLVFPFAVGGRRVSLHCEPGGTPRGHLRTARRPGSAAFDGEFLLELTRCRNARTGKSVDWPPTPPPGLATPPLEIRGRFENLRSPA